MVDAVPAARIAELFAQLNAAKLRIDIVEPIAMLVPPDIADIISDFESRLSALEPDP